MLKFSMSWMETLRFMLVQHSRRSYESKLVEVRRFGANQHVIKVLDIMKIRRSVPILATLVGVQVDLSDCAAGL